MRRRARTLRSHRTVVEVLHTGVGVTFCDSLLSTARSVNTGVHVAGRNFELGEGGKREGEKKKLKKKRETSRRKKLGTVPTFFLSISLSPCYCCRHSDSLLELYCRQYGEGRR